MKVPMVNPWFAMDELIRKLALDLPSRGTTDMAARPRARPARAIRSPDSGRTIMDMRKSRPQMLQNAIRGSMKTRFTQIIRPDKDWLPEDPLRKNMPAEKGRKMMSWNTMNFAAALMERRPLP
jgi:hypothetical protein